MSGSRKVLVELTDKMAIYVDGTRITNRETKWGLHWTRHTFQCVEEDVVQEMQLRGHHDYLHRIDCEPYKTQATAALTKTLQPEDYMGV